MTDKKFTDEEIIKALECHINAEDCVSCEVFDWCEEILLTELVLDLINRQKAEIERLKECPKCVYEYDGEVMEYCVQSLCSNFKTVEQVKAEAYKEYHIKAKSCLKANRDVEQQIGNNYVVKRIKEIENRFDNILKEMVGEEE